MNVVRTVIPVSGGFEFVYVTSTGQYLGRVRAESIDGAAMEIMAKDFVAFLKEQAAEAERPQIALAVNSSLRGN